jgi:hypothetical protein
MCFKVEVWAMGLDGYLGGLRGEIPSKDTTKTIT